MATRNTHADGQTLAVIKQNFNPLVQKLRADFSVKTQGLPDRRLGMAAALLPGAIEARQR